MPTPEAHQILKDTFGYDTFRSSQEAIIAAILTGDNVLAVMPTGAGKSMCYQIPALIRQGVAIVVSPLVALMEDQVSALKLAGVAAETINSSRSYEINADTWRATAAGRVRLLYLSPERLMTERMLTALGRLPVTLLAVDEAHCISRWGQSFRPEYEALSRLSDVFPEIPIAALTATADEATRRDIAEKLFGGRGQTFVSGFDRPNIRMHVVARRDRNPQMLNVVRGYTGQSGIIYCLSRAKVERAAEFLNANGVRALPYHAGMEKADRAKHQDIFMTEPGVVMVATIAFGMGIDKPDVRFVIHTDLPGNIEAYYQEIGRAGRDGEPAEAHLFYGLDDIRLRRQFIDDAGGDSDHVRREHKRLDALIAYCEAPECRRRALLAYFGENSDAACGNCDVCIDPPQLVDGTALAQMALAAIVQTGQRFGAVHLIDVLRGADTEITRPEVRARSTCRLQGRGWHRQGGMAQHHPPARRRRALAARCCRPRRLEHYEEGRRSDRRRYRIPLSARRSTREGEEAAGPEISKPGGCRPRALRRSIVACPQGIASALGVRAGRSRLCRVSGQGLDRHGPQATPRRGRLRNRSRRRRRQASRFRPAVPRLHSRFPG